MLPGNERQRLGIKFVNYLGGCFGFGGFAQRLNFLYGRTFTMGIRIGKWPFNALATQDHHKAMRFAGPNDYLDATDLINLSEFLAKPFVDLGGDAASATIEHNPFLI